MKKTIIYISLVTAFCCALLLYVVKNTSFKENTIYSIDSEKSNKNSSNIISKVNSKESNNFYSIDIAKSIDSDSNIIVSISPDKNSVLYMTTKATSTNIIKGRTSIDSTLYLKDLHSGETTLLSEKVPFVTSVKWNKDGSYAAIQSDTHISLYNSKLKKLVFNNELNTLTISGMGWSPNGEKLYLEYPNLPNGDILYTNPLKIVPSYEAKEDTYIKDSIDGKNYFATKVWIDTSMTLSSNCVTIICDENGKQITSIDGSIFRDRFNKAVLTKDLSNRFIYFKDYNSPNSKINQYGNMVYDCKFVYNGNFAVISEVTGNSKNTFDLTIFDSSGEHIKSYDVSGSSILIRPDGKVGYINGPKKEVINFEDNSLISDTSYNEPTDKSSETLIGLSSSIKQYLYQNTDIKKDYVSESGLNSLAKIITKINSSVPAAVANKIAALNPEETITLLKVNKLSESKVQYTINLKANLYFSKNFDSNFKVELIKDNDHWVVNDIAIL